MIILNKQNSSMKSQVAKRCMLLGFLLFLRCLNLNFIYPAVVAAAICIYFSDLRVATCVLFFLLPLGGVFKMAYGGTSFFTIISLLYIFRLIVKLGFRRETLSFVLIFFIFCLLHSSVEHLVTIVTITLGFVLISYAHDDYREDYPLMVYAFVSGLLVASVIGLFRAQLPLVAALSEVNSIKTGTLQYVDRFAGLHGNPNYFTLDVTIGISCMIVLLCRHKTRAIDILLMMVLIVFGVMSVSQSFLLVLAIQLIMLLFAFSKMGAKKLLMMIVGGFFILALVFFLAYDSIQLYLFRAEDISESSLNDITTGRWDIWVSFLQSLIRTPKIMLTGSGIMEAFVSRRGAHNTFIELVYTFGVIGTAIYLITLFRVARHPLRKKQIVDKIIWIPIVSLLLRMMFIGIVTYDSLPYYFFLICVINNALAASKPMERNSRYFKTPGV